MAMHAQQPVHFSAQSKISTTSTGSALGTGQLRLRTIALAEKGAAAILERKPATQQASGITTVSKNTNFSSLETLQRGNADSSWGKLHMVAAVEGKDSNPNPKDSYDDILKEFTK